MSKIAGIDLGTTNSSIAVMEGSQPIVIPIAEGGRLCPSVVGFTPTGEQVIGVIAKRQAITHPSRTIASIKRKMGQSYHVRVDEKEYTPQEISAIILRKLKADAEAWLGEPLTKAVITVPAYFSDAQRQATRDAGAIAGLEVVRILNEPTAAALAYGMDREDLHTILVWDLGGGTFDVSILDLDNGLLEVLSTCGDTELGGDDWDKRISDWIADEFRKTHHVDLRRELRVMQRIIDAAEKAKIELSAQVQTEINLPFLYASPEAPLHWNAGLTRAQFEALTTDLLDRLIKPTRQAIQDAKLRFEEIDRVVLVGGSTRMPAVQALAKRLFQKDPYIELNPDEAVTLGAAIQAGTISGDSNGPLLLDVTPLSLGIETLGGAMTRIIDRNTAIPTSRTEIFTTAEDGQRAVDIKVYQGEKDIASYNRFLAQFQLNGIHPAPKGAPRVEVTFDIDVNGIVQVFAKDAVTGNAQSVEITACAGLSKEEIERITQETFAKPD